MRKVLLELAAIKASTPLIVPGQEHFSIQARCSATNPREKTGLTPYVGGDINWTPEYITRDSKTVLIVIIEPPRPGDPIHLLRKDLDRFTAGVVFVRHPGKTMQASVDDMRMLQRRLLAGNSQINLRIEPVQMTIESWKGVLTQVDGKLAARQSLLDAGREKKVLHRDDEPLIIGSSFFAGSGPDPRTSEEYDRAAELHIDKYRDALLLRAVWLLVRHIPAMLTLRIVNQGPRNFSQVRVVATVESSAVNLLDQDLLDLRTEEKPSIPEPPAPLGAPYGGRMQFGMGIPGLPSSLRFPIVSLPQPGRGWDLEDSVENDGQVVRIVFDSCDVRPHDSLTLPSVPLLVQADPGSEVTFSWSATATNADDQASGKFTNGVVASTISLDG